LSIAKEISEFVGTGNITIYDTSDMEKIRDLSQQNTATEPDETHDFKGLIKKAEEVSDGFSYLSFLSGYLEVIQDPYYDQVMFLEGLLDNINQQIREEETEEVEKPEKWSEVKQGEKDLMEDLEEC
jgi:lipid II:glycine glycyltransferase (peptidoglycan interpeptide bridge formation enzyme)